MIGCERAAELNPIRAVDHEGERRAGNGVAACVAHQSREIDGLDRNRRRDIDIERSFSRNGALPHCRTALIGEPLDLIAVETALEIVAL